MIQQIYFDILTIHNMMSYIMFKSIFNNIFLFDFISCKNCIFSHQESLCFFIYHYDKRNKSTFQEFNFLRILKFYFSALLIFRILFNYITTKLIKISQFQIFQVFEPFFVFSICLCLYVLQEYTPHKCDNLFYLLIFIFIFEIFISKLNIITKQICHRFIKNSVNELSFEDVSSKWNI